jgi:hypothetical protein
MIDWVRYVVKDIFPANLILSSTAGLTCKILITAPIYPEVKIGAVMKEKTIIAKYMASEGCDCFSFQT